MVLRDVEVKTISPSRAGHGHRSPEGNERFKNGSPVGEIIGYFYCIYGNFNYHFTIDRCGRIVVPKALRERFGLHPCTELEIEAEADGLRLRARDSAPAFIEKDGVLVHHAAGPALVIDVADFLNRERQGQATSLTKQS